VLMFLAHSLAGKCTVVGCLLVVGQMFAGWLLLVYCKRDAMLEV
jgi:hypothetical protein